MSLYFICIWFVVHCCRHWRKHHLLKRTTRKNAKNLSSIYRSKFKERTSGVLLLLMMSTWCCSCSTFAVNAQRVGTPTSATVCTSTGTNTTVTMTCDITQSENITPVWRVFTTSDNSGSPVASLDNGENSPPYNYPTVQVGDTVARLEVAASSNIDGHHFQCRLYFTNHVDSPSLGNITIITDVPSCPSSVVAAVHDDNDAITVTWQQPPNTPPVTSTTVTYCPTSSPNCGNSVTCTSPCTISGLDPGTEYQFTVIPNNICGSPTGCTGNATTTVQADTSAGVVPRVQLFITLTCLVSLYMFLQDW